MFLVHTTLWGYPRLHSHLGTPGSVIFVMYLLKFPLTAHCDQQMPEVKEGDLWEVSIEPGVGATMSLKWQGDLNKNGSCIFQGTFSREDCTPLFLPLSCHPYSAGGAFPAGLAVPHTMALALATFSTCLLRTRNVLPGLVLVQTWSPADGTILGGGGN